MGQCYRIVRTVIIILIVVLVDFGRVVGQPVNDSFKAAEIIRGDYIEGSVALTNATFEAGEPLNLERTVWYRWTPAAAGVATIYVVGNTGKAVSAAAYVGEWPALKLIDSVLGSPSVALKFPVPAGQVISIQLASARATVFNNWAETASWTVALQTAGSLVEGLNVQNPFTVESDELAHAVVLRGELASGITYPAWADHSPIDPPEAGVNNHWYAWTAPHSGNVRVTCATPWPVYQGLSYRDRKSVGVFTGPDVSHLTTVASASSTGTIVTSFHAVGGQTYYLAVGKQTTDAILGWIITTVTQDPRVVDQFTIDRAVRLRVASELTKRYQIQISEDLKVWQNVGEALRGTGQPDWLYSPTTTISPRFYRVVEIDSGP